MKNLMIILIMLICNVANAAIIEKNATIAVMDLGTHEKSSDTNLALMNAEKSASEYIIHRFLTKTKLNVIDKETVQEKLKDLKIEGLISPDDAKKIGEILGVQYIVYGNVVNFSVSETVHHGYSWIPSERTEVTIETKIIIRLMEVETGKIVMAAKGMGKDTSTSGNVAFIIHTGEFAISEHELQKALQKAAFQATDILIERLFDVEKKNKKKK